MHVFNSLAPVVLIIALGAGLLKSRFLSEADLNKLNRVTYWVGLPCLLFYKIASAHYDLGTAGRVFLVVVIGMSGVLILAYLTAWLLRTPAGAVGTFVQAAFRGNLAFIGLPVLIYTSSDLPGVDGNLEMLGILVIAPITPIYNLLSVIVLLVSRQKSQRGSLKKFLQPMLANPLVIASVAGGAFVLMGWELPLALARTFEAVSQMALPLALICIGGALASAEFHARIGFAAAAALLKVGAAPVIGFYAAQWLHLLPAETRIALIYLACPTAAASYVLTNQIGGDDALAAGAVVISTVLGMISLGVVVALN
jgi:hypothetical protein